MSWEGLDVAVYVDDNLVSHAIYLHELLYVEANIHFIMEYFYTFKWMLPHQEEPDNRAAQCL
jgi:hypothetical protein